MAELIKKISAVLMTNTVGMDVVKYVFSKAIPGIIGFFSVILFIRVLGNEEYGVYSLFFTSTNMLSAFACKWVCQSILRYYKLFEDSSLKVESVGNMKIIAYVGVILSSIVSAVIFISFSSGLHLPATLSGNSFVMVVFFGTIVLSLYNVDITIKQAMLKPGVVVFLEAARSLVSLFLFLLLCMVSRSYLVAAFSFSFAVLVSLILANKPENKITHDKCSWDNRLTSLRDSGREIISRFWFYGWPLSFWFLCIGAIQLTDRYLIQYFYSLSETGAYSSIYDVVIRSYSLFLFPVTLAVHPRIMNSWNDNKKKEALALLNKGILAQLVISLPILLVYGIGGRLIVDMLLPGQAEEYKTLVLPIAVGGLLWQLALLVHKPLEIAGKTMLMLAAVVCALFVNVAGNYILLPVIGVVASAYTTILSSLVYFLLCFLLSALVRNKNL